MVYYLENIGGPSYTRIYATYQITKSEGTFSWGYRIIITERLAFYLKKEMNIPVVKQKAL